MQITCCDIELDANVVRMVLAQDISSRLPTDVAESARNRTVHKVLHNLAEGLVLLGSDSKPLFVNAVACQILGLPEQDPLISTSNIAWDLLISRTEPSSASGYETGALKVLDATHRVDVLNNPATEDSKTERLLILHDDSKQRENAQKLVLLRRAVEAVSDGVVIVDAKALNQPMIYVNTAFEDMTGYRASEVIGSNCRFLQKHDVDQAGLVAIRRAIAKGSSQVAELRNYRKDGSMFWIQLRISPVRDDAGVVTHYIGIQTDISERKRLEEESIFLSTHDSVTGLLKYSGSEARVEVLLQQAQLAGLKWTPQSRQKCA